MYKHNEHMSTFDSDPRKTAEKSRGEAWENVGALEKFPLVSFLKQITQATGISITKKSCILELGSGEGRFAKKLRARGLFVIDLDWPSVR
jgi:hypothetical protein